MGIIIIIIIIIPRRRLHLDAVFFISVYSGLKCCRYLLDATGIRVLARNFTNSSLFTDTCEQMFRLLTEGGRTEE
jgi:hypothetical protein